MPILRLNEYKLTRYESDPEFSVMIRIRAGEGYFADS